MKPGFVLAIDVGNTATSMGLFRAASNTKNPKPTHLWTIRTGDIAKKNRFAQFLKRKLRSAHLSPISVVGGMVSSVVPPVDKPLAAQLKQVFGYSFAFVSPRTARRVKILTKKPSELGADRIVNARAAIEFFNGPSIVVDFGTATTFDCVSRSGAYLGGVIAPGPAISAEALYKRTAKLPMVFLDKPAVVLGRNTTESIRSGLYHGYRGLVQEIVFQLRKKMGVRTQVIATGGQAHWILKGAKGIDSYVPHLTLAGLFHLWRDARVM